ncbi:hypothetical protein G6F46_011222 [Rhizopus delemar]|uniref:beta-N-acetylhexosaminidase n=2 Tax=Rhizopus TaxID=4842 RepID=A0A9P6YTN6_9FUNG|nr:hypothetical protein G6F55_010619 [Rhizopus delemar]KAG1535840.1 hypothetical protein G6F51_011312 [Rhizopus arrhizus]KAG1490168.1 hypothetical protein G6F54_010922 [Rhizopus delemar]KAG1502108.1 hypothetical protein G6F53_010932 [Rhizopus delemar]KAG1512597.1 hypothetical protein G6F52_010368 [Rhizopus delemar]
METGLFELNLDDEFHITGSDSDILVEAIDRYTRLIMHDKWIPVQIEPYTASKNLHIKLRRLQINVEDINKELEYGVDESYELEIPDNETTATINSNTIWGAIRGLETFSQLIQYRPRLNKHGEQDIKNYHENDDDNDDDEEEDDIGFSRSFIANVPINIRDYPKFSHRGLMLDTSRNYFPVKDILRTIDAMAYNKMNVFHWHITDSHSFPIKLENAPELAHEGAYKLHQKRLIYRKKDVERVIDYAYRLGIRVIPEIDMPAHTGSWALSHKDIVTCSGKHYLDPSNDWSQRFAAEPGTGQLNPVLPKTYDIVNKVITEIGSLFKDNWYHGGGDEPIYKCWEQDESVLKYMKENNMTGVDLLDHFLDKELNTIQKIAGKVPILWEGI